VETLTLNFNYAHQAIYSATDLCYQFTPNPQAPLPAGATNAGTCTAANGGTSSLYLGNGWYHVPTTFFLGGGTWVPSKYVVLSGAFRINSNTTGEAEIWNPLTPTGSIQSKRIEPYVDLQLRIASQWWWHGNWENERYDEDGAATGPPPRVFHGNIYTLGVKYAF